MPLSANQEAARTWRIVQTSADTFSARVSKVARSTGVIRSQRCGCRNHWSAGESCWIKVRTAAVVATPARFDHKVDWERVENRANGQDLGEVLGRARENLLVEKFAERGVSPADDVLLRFEVRSLGQSEASQLHQGRPAAGHVQQALHLILRDNARKQALDVGAAEGQIFRRDFRQQMSNAQT